MAGKFAVQNGAAVCREEEDSTGSAYDVNLTNTLINEQPSASPPHTSSCFEDDPRNESGLTLRMSSAQCTEDSSGDVNQATSSQQHMQCTDEPDSDSDELEGPLTAGGRHYSTDRIPVTPSHNGSTPKPHQGRYSFNARSFESHIKLSHSGDSILTQNRHLQESLDLHGRLLLTPNKPARCVDVSESVVSTEEIRKAYKTVHKVLKNNPKALGIVLLAYHTKVPESVDLKPLKGIENGATELHKAFTDLGLAVVWLKNPSTKSFKAVMKVMASCAPRQSEQIDHLYRISYPESYKYFFFYTTGHGARRVFFTKDCAVAYSTVYDHFKGLLEQRYFFFDCCRTVRVDDVILFADSETERGLPEIPGLNIEPGNIIVYATLDTKPSWGPEQGPSFMTTKMTSFLKEDISIHEMIRRLMKEMPNEVADQQPVLVAAMGSEAYLIRTRDMHMKSELQPRPTIDNNGSVGQFCGILPSPLVKSKSFQDKCTYIEMKREDDGTWQRLSELISANLPQRCSSLSRSRSQSTFETRPSIAKLETSSSSYREPHASSIGRSVHSGAEPKQISKMVSLFVQKSTTAEVRMVTEYKGGMKTISDSLAFQVPTMAVPVIRCAHLSRSLHRNSPKVCVTWTSQSTSGIHRFLVKILTPVSREEPVCTKIEQVHGNRRTYRCSIGLNDYQEGEQYSVVVTAERLSGQMVSSDVYEVTKGCCFKYRKCIALMNTLLTAIAISLVLDVLFGINRAAMAGNKCTIMGADTTARIVFEPNSVNDRSLCYSLPSNCSFCTPNFNMLTLSRITPKNKNTEKVYCKLFSKADLVNGLTSEDIFPNVTDIDDFNQTLAKGSITTLPIGNIPYGVYLLPHSAFNISMCLYSPPEGTVKNESVQFDKSGCSNTSVIFSKAALVIAALSTSSEIQIKTLQGSVNQVSYNQEIQDQLETDANLLKPHSSLPFYTSTSSKLLCLVDGYSKSEVISGLIHIVFPYTWKGWVLPTLVPLAVVAHAVVVGALVLIVVGWCYRRKCSQCWLKKENDYEELNAR